MMKSVTKEKVFHVLKLVLLAVTVTLVLLSLLGTVAHASGLVDDTVNADNLYSKYPLSNYQLDFYVDNSWSWLPWNWLDGIGKSVQYGLYCITNFVWTISLYLSNATGYVVQQAYKLNFINDMADSIGKSIQTLAGVTEHGFSSSGFYVGFLLIIILIVGVYTAYTGLLKRETSKALVEERENRQEQRTQKRNLHRENISQKKQELQKAQEARQTVHANGSATAGATRSHERPVATPVPKPAQTDTVTKPDMKRPATSPVIKNAEIKAGKETVRTNIRQEQQVKSVARTNQPNVAETISNHKKSTVQKTQVNGKSARKTVTKHSEKGRKK